MTSIAKTSVVRCGLSKTNES